MRLFEFEGLAWLPKSIRDAGTDHLRLVWEAGAYKPIVPRLRDALVSGLRLYSVRQLQQIVQALPPNDYVWEIGAERFPRSITYLIGYPQLRV